jgi:hypothetical protein
MLDQYIGQHMDINNQDQTMVSKNRPMCIQNRNTSQTLIFGGYTKTRKYSHTRDITLN